METGRKPRKALRVGVTGHRKLETSQVEALRPRVHLVLAQIRAAANRIFQDSSDAWSHEPAKFRAVSPLAEGADRMFAEEALDLGFTLDAPLPFHRKEYEKDFANSVPEFERLLAKADSVLELPGGSSGRDDDYELVGRFVLDQCDLLIALWNGQPPEGKGGTEQIRAEAIQCHLPVVTIYTTSEKTRIALHGESELEYSEKLLDEALHRMLYPPWLSIPSDDPLAKDPDVTGAYLEKASRNPSLLGAFWRRFVDLLSAGCKLDQQSKHETPGSVYLDLFRYYDDVANRFAGHYRGAFLASYLLGVCAVFLALLSYAAREFAAFELTVVAAGLLLVIATRRYRWHFRSIDCRYLAEQFRILCYVHPLGLPAPRLKLAAHHVHADVGKSWMEWFLRATIRSVRMPAGELGSEEVSRAAADITGGWIKDQVAYHQQNHQRMHCAEERSVKLVWICAAVAAIACFCHFVLDLEAIVPCLTFCAAGFPAASAAFHAIATQGEFRRLAERSGSMAKSLDRLQQTQPAGFQALRTVARQAADLMIEEVVDWQILYRKEIEP